MTTTRVALLAGLLAVLLVVVFVFGLYGPRVEEQRLLESETATLQQQQAQLRSQITELETIRDDQPRIAALLASLETLVPGDVAQPQAVRDLQTVADAAGVEIVSIAFGDPLPLDPPAPAGPGRQLGRVPVTMTIEGGYFQAVDFFRRIESDTPRAVLVDSVAMTEAADGFPTLSAGWTGAVFGLIPVEAVPPEGGAPAPEGAPQEGTPAPVPPEVAPPEAPGQDQAPVQPEVQE